MRKILLFLLENFEQLKPNLINDKFYKIKGFEVSFHHLGEEYKLYCDLTKDKELFNLEFVSTEEDFWQDFHEENLIKDIKKKILKKKPNSINQNQSTNAMEIKSGKLKSRKFLLEAEEKNIETVEREILEYLYKKYKKGTDHYTNRITLSEFKRKYGSDENYLKTLDKLVKDDLVGRYLDKEMFKLMKEISKKQKKSPPKEDDHVFIYLSSKAILEMMGWSGIEEFFQEEDISEK